MRRLIVDKARARKAYKRGDGALRVNLVDAMIPSEHQADQILSVDRALTKLARENPRRARLVELRYFAGMSIDEVATALSVSGRTARREWQVARLQLKEAIDGTGSAA
jgi:RNA polymerase sigma factor (TIGR02999 family)